MLHFKLHLNLVITDLSSLMADNLHLVFNERGNYNLVHEGRVYNLKRTNTEDKQWIRRRVKKGCRGSIYTNLHVNGILSSDSHADDCTPDNDILYKMEKKNALKRRVAEETKTVPQIYHEEASSASAGLQTADHSVWSMDGTFKIVPEWYQQMFTIHVFIAGGSTYKVVPSTPASSAEVKMLLVMASSPLRDVPAAVELLGRDATGSVAALFNYFRVEWMPYDRLSLWN
ncbi:hypothetical protein T07_14581, partial [Trichinella nelsoni]